MLCFVSLLTFKATSISSVAKEGERASELFSMNKAAAPASVIECNRQLWQPQAVSEAVEELASLASWRVKWDSSPSIWFLKSIKKPIHERKKYPWQLEGEEAITIMQQRKRCSTKFFSRNKWKTINMKPHKTMRLASRQCVIYFWRLSWKITSSVFFVMFVVSGSQSSKVLTPALSMKNIFRINPMQTLALYGLHTLSRESRGRINEPRIRRKTFCVFFFYFGCYRIVRSRFFVGMNYSPSRCRCQAIRKIVIQF